ncbi:MAG: hypothetical protein AABX51_03480 [Nanoarchaeota archaeon]
MLRKLLPFLKKDEERWDHLDDALTSAFGKVRQDTHNLFSWISYFHQHLTDHRKETHHLRQKFEEQNKHIIYLHHKIEELEKKIGIIETKPVQVPQIVHFSEPNPNQIRTKPEPVANLRRPRFEEKVLSKIRTKKRPYILQKILDTIGEAGYSTKELERIIVDEQQLCGRTSFYSYIKELRLKKQISLKEKEFDKVLVRT